MSPRALRAARLATQVGLVMAALGLVRGLLLGYARGRGPLEALALVLAAPALAFALFFVLVFSFAYAFPPPADKVEFSGARWLVWPLVLIAVAGVLVFAFRTR